jgi:hypothetical protein
MVKKRKEKLSNEPAMRKPLRLWPGVIIGCLLLLVRFGIFIISPEAIDIAVYGGVLLGLAVIVWWLFFSRAPWIERLGAVILMIVLLFLTYQVLDESVAKAGMGMMFPILAIPFLSLAFVIWAVACYRLSTGPRRVSMAVVILLACGAWTLVRTGGLDAGFNHDFAWRWTETAEEKFLAQKGDKQKEASAISTEMLTEAEWPGFRGPNRDSIIRSSQIETDWSVSPPVEMWRRLVGPGWSSFAVHGDLFYTQEQHGEHEVVSCYNMYTGEPVWIHRDPVRFWESNSGPGPRGTPTLSGGRVYSLGAIGIMNVLDAMDGSVIWSRNAATDTGTKIPYWGFSGSPLVIENLVIVAAAGSLIAYDRSTGNINWIRSVVGDCHSSPHLLHIDGFAQILLQNKAGLISVNPDDGTLLWEHAWEGYPIVQPALIADGEILISVDEKSGVRRIAVVHGSDGWRVEERWTSSRLKPYFNDSVIHNGHAYGFDGPFLVCIAVKNGERMWKGGRYGRGQFVLLAEQNLLLVLSEQGELALVKATPEQFTELARFSAIVGKTWNHPVLVGDILLVRNAQEMAAFQLTLAGS